MKITNTKKYSVLISSLISIIIGFIIGAIILAMAGYDPVQAYRQMLIGVFGKPKYITLTIIKATPLILTGLSVAFAFRTGLFNIGAEGQFIIGTVAAAVVGYFIKLPPIIHPLVVLFIAMIAAGLWGGIAGILKAKFGVNEVISTIMLNWIALYVHNYIITIPFIEKRSNVSHDIQPTASMVILEKWKMTEEGRVFLNTTWGDFLKADFNAGILIAILAVIIIWFILNKTTLGYKLKAVGFNPEAAEQSGISVSNNIMIAMYISGALSGLAGAIQILGGGKNISTLAAMEGYGFDGIAVSLIGGNTPIGSLLGGLLFGMLKYGGSKIQSPPLKAPSEVINIVIGIIIFFISMPSLIHMIRSSIKRGENIDK